MGIDTKGGQVLRALIPALQEKYDARVHVFPAAHPESVGGLAVWLGEKATRAPVIDFVSTGSQILMYATTLLPSSPTTMRRVRSIMDPSTSSPPTTIGYKQVVSGYATNPFYAYIGKPVELVVDRLFEGASACWEAHWRHTIGSGPECDVCPNQLTCLNLAEKIL